MRRLLERLTKIRWWFIFLTALLLIYREIMEPPLNPLGLGQVTEYFVYVVFLLIVGILVDELLRANAQQSRSFYILGQKHKLSIDLAAQEGWGELVRQLVQYPSTQACVDEVHLLIHDPLTNLFEKVGHWQKRPGDKSVLPSFGNSCQQCILQGQGFKPCQAQDLSGKKSLQPLEYCLPIHYGKQMVALLRFRLEPGAQLTSLQNKIFDTIGDEMGVAIKAHQEQKKVIEMQCAESSMAERKSVSHYLHDNLGQNLAYLCLKLDQLRLDQNLSSHQGEIEQMYSAANQSYEIVRNTIQTYQPKAAPALANLLTEHAKKISKRANLAIKINHQGSPVFISPDIQRAFFYVFQEVLSNVEKHARAEQVDVLVDWCLDQLRLIISDDGIGFNLEVVDHKKHSGLQNMFEHIANIHGKVDLVSLENSGTTVTITVPLSHEVAEGMVHEHST
jgi:signal transduction histidine kinase